MGWRECCLIDALIDGLIFSLFNIDLGLGVVSVMREDLVAVLAGSLVFWAIRYFGRKQLTTISYTKAVGIKQSRRSMAYRKRNWARNLLEKGELMQTGHEVMGKQVISIDYGEILGKIRMCTLMRNCNAWWHYHSVVGDIGSSIQEHPA